MDSRGRKRADLSKHTGRGSRSNCKAAATGRNRYAGCRYRNPRAGLRELGIPTVTDRLIQQALLQVMQARIDRTFSAHSQGFRPGRRTQDAVLQAQRQVQEAWQGIVDVALEKFFERVNHDVLMDRLSKKFAHQHHRAAAPRWPVHTCAQGLSARAASTADPDDPGPAVQPRRTTALARLTAPARTTPVAGRSLQCCAVTPAKNS